MSFPGGGGDNSVFVDIQGTSVSLVDAAKMASDALLMTADSMGTLAGAADAMGGSVSASVGGFSEMGSAALAASAELEDFAASTRMAADSAAGMSGVIGGGGGGGGGGFGAMLGGMFGSGGLAAGFDMLGDAIGAVIDPMVGFIQQAGSMLAGLISFSVLNDVIQEVQGFTDALVQLNIQTEKNQFAWRYLYGGGNTPQGAQIAQQMADWTKKFSMQIPYTRQDLLNSVTTLAPMGLSSQGLEHYMPMIADLAATRDPNANLAQVAQVIMSASMGYTRMLKYDLKINPEDLIQYGLKATGTGTGIHISDPSTLLPALENYSKAKGLSGAAKDIATDTFWGSWSSFIDRIQNFELDSGHGLFGSLKAQLNDLSSWIDTHTDQINRFASLFSDTVANAFKTAAGTVGDFMSGVGSSGLFAGLTNDAVDISPQHPSMRTQASGLSGNAKGTAGLRGQVSGSRSAAADTKTSVAPPQNLNGWQQAGQIIGDALKQIGEGWDTVSKAWSPAVQTAISDVGKAFQDFGKSLTPDDITTLKQIGGVLLSIPWALISGALGLLALGVNFLTFALNNVIHPLMSFGTWLGQLPTTLGQLKDQFVSWAGNLKDNFLTWGGDLITNLINGITGKAADLAGAVGNVATVIWSHLHQSTAEVGPLAHSDEWMPDMMDMFAQQLTQGASRVGSAAGVVADSIYGALKPSSGYLPANAAASAGVTVINIYGNGTEEMMKVIDHANAKGARVTNLQSRASSGYGAYQFGTLGGLR